MAEDVNDDAHSTKVNILVEFEDDDDSERVRFMLSCEQLLRLILTISMMHEFRQDRFVLFAKNLDLEKDHFFQLLTKQFRGVRDSNETLHLRMKIGISQHADVVDDVRTSDAGANDSREVQNKVVFQLSLQVDGESDGHGHHPRGQASEALKVDQLGASGDIQAGDVSFIKDDGLEMMTRLIDLTVCQEVILTRHLSVDKDQGGNGGGIVMSLNDDDVLSAAGLEEVRQQDHV